MDKPNYYSILTADVRYSDKISTFDKLLYSDITSLTNKNGYCNASNKYFSKVFNKSISSITRSISNLIDNKFIRSVLIRDSNNSIIQRRIYLVSTVNIPVPENDYTPMVKNDYTPMVKNAQDNNTSNINNTSNNISIIKNKNSDYDQILSLWNDFAHETGLSQIRQLTPKRIANINARKKQHGFKLSEVLDAIRESSHCRGDNNLQWKINFDWIFSSSNNWVKLVEGNYKDRQKNKDKGLTKRTEGNLNALGDFLNSQKKGDLKGLNNGLS